MKKNKINLKNLSITSFSTATGIDKKNTGQIKGGTDVITANTKCLPFTIRTSCEESCDEW